jgi:SAM-dependent methyltransferase
MNEDKSMMIPGSGALTDKRYWLSRQSSANRGHTPTNCAFANEWVADVVPYLRFQGVPQIIEFGCNPGFASLAVFRHLDFVASGIDLDPCGDVFLKNMSSAGCRTGAVYVGDARQIELPRNFDMVFSAGLVEHFEDPEGIIAAHCRAAKAGGYVLITVPNFRGLQWLYHRAFDAEDLLRHNLAVMEPGAIEASLVRAGARIERAGYSGGLRFWNYTDHGMWLGVQARRIGSKAARVAADLVRLCPGTKGQWMAPWRYVLARL